MSGYEIDESQVRDEYDLATLAGLRQERPLPPGRTPHEDAETDAALEERLKGVRLFTEDPRWTMLLRAADRRLMRVLLAWCDLLTGDLEYPARAVDLGAVLEATEETLRRSRRRLLDAGLIVSYKPGTGHTASTYRVARSWDEAAEAAARRRRQSEPMQ